MNVDLLLAPDCPHADAARAVLDECLDRLGLQVRVRERVGDYPSPTVLVDGVDVMTDAAGMPPVRACRLDVPSRWRVGAPLRARATAGRRDVTGNQSRYRPWPLLGPISARVRELSPPARALHRTILNAFAATGLPPDPASLPAPGGHDRQVLLRELHDRDAVRLDAYGGIRAAYPFSGTPTTHTVAIAGGSTVWAMCAIDALGIAAMLGRDVTITSRDPYTGEPVRVEIRDRRAAWEPDTSVVVDGVDTSAGDRCCPGTAGDGAAAAADRRCHVMNFFASPATATAWLAEHPTVSGVVLTKEQALRRGVDIFGDLLDD